MSALEPNHVVEIVPLRNKTAVFADRTEAGRVTAGLLKDFRNARGIVLAVPAGGVPVGKAVADALGLPLDVLPVSKITLPWNTEAGYGAVSFNGIVELNQALLSHLHLSPEEIKDGTARTLQKVKTRMGELRGNRPFPPLSDKTVILVDDGLASGFTLQVAVEALRKEGARHIILAVPTGHEKAVHRLAKRVDAVYCPNIRTGPSFAVADAYQHWYDLGEAEVKRIFRG